MPCGLQITVEGGHRPVAACALAPLAGSPYNGGTHSVSQSLLQRGVG